METQDPRFKGLDVFSSLEEAINNCKFPYAFIVQNNNNEFAIIIKDDLFLIWCTCVNKRGYLIYDRKGNPVKSLPINNKNSKLSK